MTTFSSGYDTDDARTTFVDAIQHSPPPIELKSVVIHYANRPDRCTITPRECTDTERSTTWLSADTETVVDLGDIR